MGVLVAMLLGRVAVAHKLDGPQDRRDSPGNRNRARKGCRFGRSERDAGHTTADANPAPCLPRAVMLETATNLDCYCDVCADQGSDGYFLGRLVNRSCNSGTC